jgi:hypothetical protein
MFDDPGAITMMWVTIVYTGVLLILGTKPKRSRVAAGSANQYSIAPTQTILSLRFFEPKLRRMAVILTLFLVLHTVAGPCQ